MKIIRHKELCPYSHLDETPEYRYSIEIQLKHRKPALKEDAKELLKVLKSIKKEFSVNIKKYGIYIDDSSGRQLLQPYVILKDTDVLTKKGIKVIIDEINKKLDGISYFNLPVKVAIE